MIKHIIHKLGRAYIERINLSEQQSQNFKRHNERTIEYRFVFDCLTAVRPVTVLDVGTGTTALPSLISACGCEVTAIDNVRDYWPRGMVNRHWQIFDDDITKPKLAERFDMVTCISVIEHIGDHQSAFKSMINFLKPGGYLVLTTPYNEHRGVPNVYDLPGAAYGKDSPYVCRSTSRLDLNCWLKQTSSEIVRQEFWNFWSGDVWTQGEILAAPQSVGPTESHQLTCLLVKKPA